MNMRQFWQKLPNDDRIDYTIKITAPRWRDRNGRVTFSSNMSWRRLKKQLKMSYKRNGKVLFFLNKTNCDKALDITWRREI
jgi:hypothetical protein